MESYLFCRWIIACFQFQVVSYFIDDSCCAEFGYLVPIVPGMIDGWKIECRRTKNTMKIVTLSNEDKLREWFYQGLYWYEKLNTSKQVAQQDKNKNAFNIPLTSIRAWICSGMAFPCNSRFHITVVDGRSNYSVWNYCMRSKWAKTRNWFKLWIFCFCIGRSTENSKRKYLSI